MKKFKIPKVGGGKLTSVIVFLLVVVFGIAIIPPVVQAAAALAKGTKSAAEALGGITTGISETASRWLAAIGIGTSPYKAQLDYYLKPPIQSCFNKDYWKSMYTDAELAEYYQSVDYFWPTIEPKFFSVAGYDVTGIKGLIADNFCDDKNDVSMFNNWFLDRKGESFPKWLNTGWFYKLSDKDTVDVCKWMEALPS